MSKTKTASQAQRLQELCDEFVEQLLQGQAATTQRLRLPTLEGSMLARFVETFGLTEFETGILLLAAALELRTTDMLGLCAVELALQNNPSGAFLTPYTLRRWLPPCPLGSDVSAFLPGGTLRRFGLVQVEASPLGGGSESMSVVRLTAGALAFLRGLWAPSSETSGLLGLQDGQAWLGDGQSAALKELKLVLGNAQERANVTPVINLYGETLAVMQDVVSNLDFYPRWTLSAEALGDEIRRTQDTNRVLGALRRDLTLLGGLLTILEDEPESGGENKDDQQGGGLAWAEALIEDLALPVVVVSRDPSRMRLGREVYTLAVHGMDPDEVVDLWLSSLRLPSMPEVTTQLEALVAQFVFSSERVRRLTQRVHRRLEALGIQHPKPVDVLEVLWEQCQQEGRKAFQGIADRVISKATREQLVLPPSDWQTIDEIIAHVRLRHRVYRAWGYEAGGRGTGITVLFSGVSGGGKTFAAEVLANELHLDLYRIDLSKVASKWIGETEKNLRRIFDAADEGGAILLFDEADSVFGKRGESQSSNDRYANMTTNYLLQRMEQYRGLAILTTNYEGNIDSAFMRRIRFTLHFRKPTPPLRLQLWEKVFPPEVYVHDLDYDFLSRWELSGANIRAIALNATFMAELRQSPVTNELVREAIRRELHRQGRLDLDP